MEEFSKFIAYIRSISDSYDEEVEEKTEEIKERTEDIKDEVQEAKEEIEEVQETEKIKEVENKVEEKDLELDTINLEEDLVQNYTENDDIAQIEINVVLEDEVKKNDSDYVEEVKPIKPSYKEEVEVNEVSVNSKTLPLVENIPYEYPKESKIIKMPVVLSKCNIMIPIESIAKLEYPISEIKEIEKDIYMKECNVVIDGDGGILFMNASIKKNVEYYSKDKDIDILRNVVIYIPLKCQTRIKFDISPQIKKNKECKEIEIFQKDINDKNNNNMIMGHNINEKNFNIGKSFSEKIICKIINVEFIETDIINENYKNSGKYELEEKSVVSIGLEILQKQDVIIK